MTENNGGYIEGFDAYSLSQLCIVQFLIRVHKSSCINSNEFEVTVELIIYNYNIMYIVDGRKSGSNIWVLLSHLKQGL